MVRFLSTLLVFTLLFTSCQNNSNTLRIKGNSDLTNGSKIFHIIADTNNQPQILDTLTTEEGAFDLNFDIVEPNLHFLQVEGIQGTFPFIAEAGTVAIELYKDSLVASKATGTVSNDKFMQYKTETKMYIASLNSIGNDLQQAIILKDSLATVDLQEQYQDVRDQIQEYELNFIRSAPDSFISILILERFIANKNISIDEAKNLYENLSDRIKNSESGRSVKQIVDAPAKAEVGAVAPLFKGPDPNGNSLALNESLGKVTIIDFWASWCRPCRVENPNLVRLYHQHKADGLSIIGVSLDKTKPQWVQAIADDGLVWNHVSNLQFWNDPIAKLYRVNAIPATFILDENGVIVSRDLRGAQLERKVQELLGKL